MKLPIIHSYAVEHLSLYSDTIKRTVQPGINLIVGGNGLGKTTLVNAICFALVGNVTYQRLNVRTGKLEPVALVPREYFQGRIEPADHDRAQITLTFIVDNLELVITRALYRPHIRRLRVKNIADGLQTTHEGEPDDLEKTYQQIMKEALAIEHFEHFVFLLANLLLFDEERRTLMWDSEVQNRVIRLLFFEREFDESFDELSGLVTQYDTMARHRSETRKDIRRSIERWLAHKADVSSENTAEETGEAEQQERAVRLAALQADVDATNDVLGELETILETEVTRLKSLTAELSRLDLEREPLIDQLRDLENQFYGSVYDSVPPDYVLVLENLAKRGSCQICGTTAPHLKKLGQRLKRDGRCVVCRSPVAYADGSGENESDDGLVSQINYLRERMDELGAAQEACTRAQASTNIQIKQLQDKLTQNNRKKRELEFQITELQAEHLASASSESTDDTDRDIWLDEQRREMTALDAEIDDLYRRRDVARESLQQLNEELLRVLYAVNERLTPLFSHFASRFLGTPCELVVSHRTVSRKPVSYMYPRFYDKDRRLVEQVSESQRFFLDQAFRMALISWFAESTGHATFYIIETPEGSLDLAYEHNVADMYVEFGTRGHSIIVTSNLNSSNFLLGLYRHLGNDRERQRRTLDLLRYGRLSSVQKEHLPRFRERLQQLELSLPQEP